jgi:hypothetical protein
MRIIRLILILSVLLVVYSVVMLSCLEPYFGIATAVVLILATAKRKVVTYTAHGTARWADASDLQAKGMVNV